MSEHQIVNAVCAFCGFHDHRHRIVDAIEERIAAGEPVEIVLGDYDLTVEEYEALTVEVYG